MLTFDPQSHKYPSVRNVVYAKNGMVCTSQPLASSIGIEIMRKGGNAIDAAIAVAGALPLIEPVCNGIGGDCFALIWTKEGKLYGLNASGICPERLTAQAVRERGFEKVPLTGWTSVIVPGAPAGWAAVQERFCTMPLTDLWEPAIRTAREGYPVSINNEPLWQREFDKITLAAARDGREAYQGWFDTFTVNGRAPRAGELFRCPDMAETLSELARTNCASFYHGELMKRIVAFSEQTGGFFTEADFEAYTSMWVEPISINYRGYDVYEIPPNGHGITVLMALNILREFDLGDDRESPQVYHKLIEAMKLAFVDTRKYVADARFMKTRVEDLLSDRYADTRRALIGTEALYPQAGDPSCGDTVYFCTADGEGNMVSFIQSNYKHFGSGIVIPGTAIALQDRAMDFSMDPSSDNYIQGGKRSYHTIIPGFLAKDGKAVGPFGVMGGFMQPQGHMQVVVNTVDFHMTPQEALDCPRFQWVGEKKVQLEQSVPNNVGKALARMGHEIEVLNDNVNMGRGQIIWRSEDGVLVGGTESRADGSIHVF